MSEKLRKELTKIALSKIEPNRGHEISGQIFLHKNLLSHK